MIPLNIKKIIAATGIALALLNPVYSKEPPAKALHNTAFERKEYVERGYMFLPAYVGFATSSNIGLIVAVWNIVPAAGTGTSVTGTISPAITVLANASLHWSGHNDNNFSASPADSSFCKAVITDASTLTLTRTTSDSANFTASVTIIEWKSTSVQSIQYGSATPGSASTTANYTITGVTLANAVVIYNGMTVSASTSSRAIVMSNVSLSSTTNVLVTRNTANATTPTVYFCVLEFKTGILQSSTQQFKVLFTGTSATQAVTSVTLNNSILVWGGTTQNTAGTPSSGCAQAVLTSGVLITFTKAVGTFNTEVVVTVVEFQSIHIRSAVQRGNTDITVSTNTNIITITSVSVAKSLIHWLGMNSIVSGSDTGSTYDMLYFHSATQVYQNRPNASATIHQKDSWEVCEFV